MRAYVDLSTVNPANLKVEVGMYYTSAGKNEAMMARIAIGQTCLLLHYNPEASMHYAEFRGEAVLPPALQRLFEFTPPVYYTLYLHFAESGRRGGFYRYRSAELRWDRNLVTTTIFGREINDVLAMRQLFILGNIVPVETSGEQIPSRPAGILHHLRQAAAIVIARLSDLVYRIESYSSH